MRSFDTTTLMPFSNKGNLPPRSQLPFNGAVVFTGNS